MHDDKYERLAAVELAKISGEIADSYVTAFEARYGFKPVLTDEDQRVFRDLRTQLGAKRAKESATHYLSMDVDWFVKNTHSVRVYKTHINQIMASMIGKRPNQPHRRDRITMKAFCDYCPVTPHKKFWGNYVLLCGYPEEIYEMKRICPECIKNGRDDEKYIYKPSREERMRIIGHLDEQIQARSRRIK